MPHHLTQVTKQRLSPARLKCGATLNLTIEEIGFGQRGLPLFPSGTQGTPTGSVETAGRKNYETPLVPMEGEGIPNGVWLRWEVFTADFKPAKRASDCGGGCCLGSRRSTV